MNSEDKLIAVRGTKLAIMDVTSATNARTMIASVLPDMPCGNSAPVLSSNHPPVLLTAILNSFVYDFVARARCGGLHLNYFVIEETALLPPSLVDPLVLLAASLAIPAIHFAPDWLRLHPSLPDAEVTPWKKYWAVTPHARLRARCMIDAVVAKLYGLEWDELSWILEGCGYPAKASIEQNPKGFWRVDKDKLPEHRHAVLTLAAFHDLKEMLAQHHGDRDAAIHAFSNASDGWQIPELLRLTDLGLGHDQRAKELQPVRSRLGPRFYDWQLTQSAEESWDECAAHASLILGKEWIAPDRQLPAVAGYATSERTPLAAERADEGYGSTQGSTERTTEEQPGLFGPTHSADRETPPDGNDLGRSRRFK